MSVMVEIFRLNKTLTFIIFGNAPIKAEKKLRNTMRNNMRNNMTYSQDKIGKKYWYFSRAL